MYSSGGALCRRLGPAVFGPWPEAKARLSEILRLAEEEGPQRIGARRSFVVVPERVWQERTPPGRPLGQWLIENTPRGTDLEIPSRREGGREIPFVNDTHE